MKKKTRIWLGVGAFVVAGSGVAAGFKPADARVAPDFSGAAFRCAPSQIILAQASAPAPQAGEAGGEQGMSVLPPDLDVARSISLIRGHLLVGDQLVREKKWDAAYPHFMHPTEELYDGLRGQLSNYGAGQFDGALKALAEVVKARNADGYAAAWKTVADALSSVDAGLKKKQTDWDGFTLETAIETMKVAPGEYQEAIVNGFIVKPVEYQDARGFIWQAEKMIDGVAPGLQKKDAGALKKIRAGFADLKKAFPTATPPKKPVRSPADVSSLVSRIELASGPLM